MVDPLAGCVSVVIPHYDQPRLLPRAIDTALRQGDVIGEVIVVDDGSSNRLDAATIRRYEETGKVRFLFNAVNRGAPHARNRGVSSARGRYIAFLDADDEWVPWKTIRQLAFLRDHSVDICSARFDRVEEGGVRRELRFPPFRGDPARFILTDGGHLQTSTLLMTTEAARVLGFDERLRKFQDWDFVFRAHARGFRFGFVPESLTLYHFDGECARMSRVVDPAYAERYVLEHEHLIGKDVAYGFLMRRVTAMYLQVGARIGALRCALRTIARYRRVAPLPVLGVLLRVAKI